VSVNYKLENNKWKVEVALPASVSGTLVWKGKSIILKGGENQFTL